MHLAEICTLTSAFSSYYYSSSSYYYYCCCCCCCCCNRLIGELRRLDPMSVNQDGHTPFQVAARSQNPVTVTAMLDTFPSCCFVGDLSSNNCEWRIVFDLLTVCASRGNAPAVGELIRRGADLEGCEVLRVIVDECVRSPAESERLLSVYHTVVEHALLWRCGRMDEKLPRPDSPEYQNEKRITVLHLLTKPSERDGMSVMEYVINRGASRLLRAIINTPGVFRFDGDKADDKASEAECHRHVIYDVTNMTPFTQLSRAENDPSGR